jgi:hypothetical protein
VQNKDGVARHFHKLQSPFQNVGLFRVSGVFPTISKDGSKLAFVDNQFKAVWLADSRGLRIVYEVYNYRLEECRGGAVYLICFDND